MRKLVMCVFCGIAAAFSMSNCATTTEIMLENSYGFDAHSPREDIQRLRDSEPDWFGQNWEQWLKKQEADGTMRYFKGESKPSLKELERDGKSRWTKEQASQAAWTDAMRQVSYYIELQIKDEYSELISEAQKQTGTQQGKTIAELKEYQAQEETILRYESISSAQFDGLREHDRFTQTWETTRQKKKITTIHCWIVYSISQESINKAHQRIAEDRETARDEKQKQKILEKREEEYFGVLSRRYENALGILEKIEFSEDEKRFREKYNELLDINARMRTLSLLNRNDKVGQEYKNILAKLGEDLRTFDPADRQFRLIESLQRQVVEKDARIDELRRGKAGYTIQPQTIIVAYPQRPSETKITSANIFAANDMVSNRDYISFATVNGINNFSRGEQGLDAPAVLVTWNDAALYCNWLSRLYGYTPCYVEVKGQIIGYDGRKNGYRLPVYSEIIAASGIFDEKEFTRTAVWSSDGTMPQPKFYKLSGGSGTVDSRLMEQSVNSVLSDMEIGFRVVRNAE